MTLVRLLTIIALTSSFQLSAVAFPLEKLDPEETDISLMSVGRSYQVYGLGGHLLLRITNKVHNFDNVMDWGIFRLSDPDFAKNYLMGDMYYGVSMRSAPRAISYYSKVENRSIWISPLRLTTKQKTKLLKRVHWWLQEENSSYLYNLWYKNCASIVRDELKNVLGDQFQDQYTSQMSKRHLRWVGEQYFYPYYGMSFFSDIFFNSSIDIFISDWIRFHIPVEARTLLKRSPAYDDSGAPIPNSRLLDGERTLYQGVKVVSPPIRYGYLVPLFFALFAIAAYFLKLRFGYNRSASVVAGVGLGFWGIFTGAMSVMLILFWAVTKHEVFYHNANLLVLWPTHLWLAGIGAAFIIKGSVSDRMRWNVDLYFKVQGLMFVVLLLVWLTGITAQNASVAYKFLLPSFAATYFSWKVANLPAAMKKTTEESVESTPGGKKKNPKSGKSRKKRKRRKNVA